MPQLISNEYRLLRHLYNEAVAAFEANEYSQFEEYCMLLLDVHDLPCLFRASLNHMLSYVHEDAARACLEEAFAMVEYAYRVAVETGDSDNTVTSVVNEMEDLLNNRCDELDLASADFRSDTPRAEVDPRQPDETSAEANTTVTVWLEASSEGMYH